MLSSLPLLFPHDPHSLYYPTLTSPPPITHDPSTTSPFDQPPSQNLQQQQSQTPHGGNHSQTLHGGHRSILSALRADENAIVMRRANIRRFGAGWLKPPGVGKTLQGMADERAEREEGEILRAREFAAAEALAAAEAEALEAEDPQPPDPNAPPDRDLDEDVPDADEADAEIWSDDDDDDINDLDDMDGLTGTNADAIAHDDFAADDADDVGRVESFVGGEVDLDDEVPDADVYEGEGDGEGEEGGSYEHTDTEVEEESSEDGVGVQVHAAGRMAEARRGISAAGASIGSSGLRRAGPTLGSWDVRTGEVVGRVNAGNPMNAPTGAGRYSSISPTTGSAIRGGRVGTPTTAGRTGPPPTAAAARNRTSNLIPGNESGLLSSSILGSSSPAPTPEGQGQRDRDAYREELRLAQRRAQRRGG